MQVPLAHGAFPASRRSLPYARSRSPLPAPRQQAHRQCLSRWQLQKAGTCEETACRFCKTRLPDWKHSFDGATAAPVGIDLTDVRAHVLTLSLALRASLVYQVMSVIYQGKTHQIAVREGPEGRELFENDIRKIFGLGTNDELQLSFGVKVPDRRLDGAEDELTLEGWESFDAAVFCASLSAGARNERTKRLGAELETPDKKTLHANKRRSLETPGRVFRRLFGGMIEDEAGR